MEGIGKSIVVRVKVIFSRNYRNNGNFQKESKEINAANTFEKFYYTFSMYVWVVYIWL